MPSVLTPDQTEAELRRLCHKLEEQTDALASRLMEAAQAEWTYKIAYAKALLRADAKTVSDREAQATLAVETELFDRKTAEAVADAAKESVRSLRDQISAVQSANANVRYAAGLS